MAASEALIDEFHSWVMANVLKLDEFARSFGDSSEEDLAHAIAKCSSILMDLATHAGLIGIHGDVGQGYLAKHLEKTRKFHLQERV